MWKLNKQVVFLQGATSNPGFLPEWASLLGGIMLCGHHLEILNGLPFFFFFFWIQRRHLEHVPWLWWGPASFHLPAHCYFPGMGSSPLCWGQRSVCVPGVGPFFPVALWRPGPSPGILCGISRSGTCCRGSGQGQDGWAHLGCLPTAASVSYLAGLFAHLQSGTMCAQGWGLQSLGSYHQQWVSGLSSEKGKLPFQIPDGALHFHFISGPTNHELVLLTIGHS